MIQTFDKKSRRIQKLGMNPKKSVMVDDWTTNKEKFDPEDVKIWDIAVEQLSRFKENKFDCVKNETDIVVPYHMFDHIIRESRPDYVQYLPYDITVKWMENEYIDDYWLKHSYYLGINIESSVTIFLRRNVEHTNLSLLWLMFHEFRHKIQFKNSNIASCIYNRNLELFADYFRKKGNSEETLAHVLHEIFPYEVDANIFATEMCGIRYPLSKFIITEDTIKQLK